MTLDINSLLARLSPQNFTNVGMSRLDDSRVVKLYFYVLGQLTDQLNNPHM